MFICKYRERYEMGGVPFKTIGSALDYAHSIFGDEHTIEVRVIDEKTGKTICELRKYKAKCQICGEETKEWGSEGVLCLSCKWKLRYGFH